MVGEEHAAAAPEGCISDEKLQEILEKREGMEQKHKRWVEGMEERSKATLEEAAKARVEYRRKGGDEVSMSEARNEIEEMKKRYEEELRQFHEQEMMGKEGGASN
mmetsp:Transcript_18519/g.46604  ORF Transcript_18519/g.46604 Transcript_18519/m.46604 type:complete len:105 (+) Transcript_18519:263-577(+)